MGNVLASEDDDGRGRLRKVRGSCQTNVDPGHFSRLNLTTRSPQRRDFFSPVHTVTAPTTLSMCEGPRREAHQSAARGRESAIRWTPDIRFRVAPAPLRESVPPRNLISVSRTTGPPTLGSFSRVLPGPRVLPGSNAHFVPPFSVFPLADFLSETARAVRPC
jgi:hypothetical protein